eukprot:4139492-Prymnesium_polylepis.1
MATPSAASPLSSISGNASRQASNANHALTGIRPPVRNTSSTCKYSWQSEVGPLAAPSLAASSSHQRCNGTSASGCCGRRCAVLVPKMGTSAVMASLVCREACSSEDETVRRRSGRLMCARIAPLSNDCGCAALVSASQREIGAACAE